MQSQDHQHSVYSPVYAAADTDTSTAEFEYTQCLDCNCPVFRATTEEWKTYCNTCYARNVRTCTTCSRAMSTTAKAYQKICGKCWLTARESSHRVCPTCTGDDATRLNMPAGATSCRKCAEKMFLRRMDSGSGFGQVSSFLINKPLSIITNAKQQQPVAKKMKM